MMQTGTNELKTRAVGGTEAHQTDPTARKMGATHRMHDRSALRGLKNIRYGRAQDPAGPLRGIQIGPSTRGPNIDVDHIA